MAHSLAFGPVASRVSTVLRDIRIPFVMAAFSLDHVPLYQLLYLLHRHATDVVIAPRMAMEEEARD